MAKDVGQETVVYVGNVYKHYIAYKLALADKAKKAGGGAQTARQTS